MLPYSGPVRALTVAVCALVAAPLLAQTQGLRLFVPIGDNVTQLVDEAGQVVHSWPGTFGLTAHMMDDGSLIRGSQTGTIPIGGSTGRLERLAFDGTLQWDMLIDGPNAFMHHDIEPMPNGNVLVIVWDNMTSAQAIAAGRDPALIASGVVEWYPDAILEIEQTGPTTGNVVWEWHLMDHVIQDFDAAQANFGNVAAHPELVDINYPAWVLDNGDWNHFNGLDYDPINDWIVICSREQGEMYIIDHSTTTAEAAGHTGGNRGRGGDILYRWGNPEAYRAGTIVDRWLGGAHDTRFVPPGFPGAGNITIFNNIYNPPTQSSIYEVTLPAVQPNGTFALNAQTGQYDPPAPSWIYTDPSFFSGFISSAQRLRNGNTLVCSGQQFELFEVDPAGAKVWSYVHTPVNQSFGLFQAHLVERALWADSTGLSVGGGQVNFDHLVGSTSAADGVWLLASVSGTTPGTLLPGGVTLPLNLDFLFAAMAQTSNTGIFVNNLTGLDAVGAASSAIVVPPNFIPPALIGTDLDFAHFVLNNSLLATRASQPVRLTIVP